MRNRTPEGLREEKTWTLRADYRRVQKAVEGRRTLAAEGMWYNGRTKLETSCQRCRGEYPEWCRSSRGGGRYHQGKSRGCRPAFHGYAVVAVAKTARYRRCSEYGHREGSCCTTGGYRRSAQDRSRYRRRVR